MGICEHKDCQYFEQGACSIGMNPSHPECSYNAQRSSKFICAACDFCGKEATTKLNISFQCMVGTNQGPDPEATCYCVCDDCREKYQDMVSIFKSHLEDLAKGKSNKPAS